MYVCAIHMNMITTTKDIRTELRSVPAAKANLIREGLDEAISMCRSDDTEEHGITEAQHDAIVADWKQPIGVTEFLEQLARLDGEATVTRDARRANTPTRVGCYYTVRSGLSTSVYFVGTDPKHPERGHFVECVG